MKFRVAVAGVMAGAIALTAIDAAWAADQGINITGNTTESVTLKNFAQTAVNASTATAEFGGISGNVKIVGNTTQSVTAQNIAQTAVNASKACLRVGTISSTTC
jgi:hypothetical protein